MANCYYVEDLDAVEAGESIALTGDEAHHASVVSRARTGERVRVGDGRGTMLDATFTAVDRNRTIVHVDEVHRVPAPTRTIGLAQALAKGDRAELAIQAATELGVDTIVPWSASRSVVRWDGDRGERALGRWRTIVREAGKQSIRPWLPVVAQPMQTSGIAALADSWQLVVLEPTATVSIREVDQARNIMLIVGPEGGITHDELAILDAAGAVSVRIGNAVLRTSTAGPAAIAALSVIGGRW